MSTESTPERVPPLPPVTTRRHIEFDVLVGSLPHPILVLAGDERVIYANVAAETFFQSSQAVLKRQLLGAIVSDDCPLITLARQVSRNGTTVNEYGVLISTPKVQAPRLVDIYGGPLPDAPDLVLLMLQQRSMAQMIERQLTHRAAARSVSGLAAVLAHEIKNPLSGIRGAAQLLEPSLSDEDRSLARLIGTETDRIKNLVDRLEVFGDERPLATEPVNIHSVLDHVKRIAETGFARGIRINEQYDPSLPPIPGNRDKLVQAFLNLVKNAAEALSEARDGGRIVLTTAFRPGVRLSVPGSQARVALPLMIEVEDNGPGIAEAVRSHLFDPFVTTKRTGTGLGLALVAKIVGDHGGIIECDSEPRKTVFRVLLPMQDRAGNLTKRGP
jgi:two-component system nitrogen regulation sensor histidine kinase GlnL